MKKMNENSSSVVTNLFCNIEDTQTMFTAGKICERAFFVFEVYLWPFSLYSWLLMVPNTFQFSAQIL